MNGYLKYIFDDFFYTIVDGLAVAISLGIFIKAISWIIPLKGWEKIKENSMTLTIIWSVILIIFATFVIVGFFAPVV